MLVVVMGVAGSGKSTIAETLAQRLGWVFLDADEFHTPANKEKMHRGIPLTDADRLPWLDAMRAELAANEAKGKSVVLACSALKEEYRQRLSRGLQVRFVHLKGSYELIEARMRERAGHFAGESILEDQFKTLEEPRDAIVVDIDAPVDVMVASILGKIDGERSSAKDGMGILRKIRARLLPFLFLLYVVAYLDRINVGFAALQMKGQLGFSDTVYGLGAGIFFAGYFLFQVPSNLVLQRVGARRWIAFLMVLWGIISAAMLFVASARSFYTLRFLLGAAEAGFFPGVIFYLRSWFPASSRAGVLALFMTAGPISGVIGGPVSGALLDWNHRGGLAGWQWMFLLEALPAVVLGLVAGMYLPDNPEKADWLTSSERGWLEGELSREHALAQPTNPAAERDGSWWSNPRLWGFAVVYFGLNCCTYGVSLWLPSALKNLSGLPNLLLGFLSAVPYLVAATAMVLVGTHSDRTKERRWHIALCAFCGAVALLVAGYASGVAVSVAAFAVALAASSSMNGPFWAMASSKVTVATAAASIALINSLGNLGSGFGPYWIGYLRQTTGSFLGGMVSVAILLTIAGLTILRLDRSVAGSS
ncbi:MAG TPA: MFS transporter [Candidatus Acidoferrum sp.]